MGRERNSDKLIGQVFGRLTITGIVPVDKRHLRVICHCACGRDVTIRWDAIRRGQVSCGCFRKDFLNDAKERQDAYKEAVAQRKQERKERGIRNRALQKAERAKRRVKREQEYAERRVKREQERAEQKALTKDFNNYPSPVTEGDVYWNLTAVRRDGKRSWIWRCNLCGKEFKYKQGKIIKGKFKSCGCYKLVRFDDTDLPVGAVSHTLRFTGEKRIEGSGDDAVCLYKCVCIVCGRVNWYPKRLFKNENSACECERLKQRRRRFIQVLLQYKRKKYPVKYDEVPALCAAFLKREKRTLIDYGICMHDLAGMRLRFLTSSSVNDNTFPTADYSVYGSLSSGEDVTMQSVVRCFSPLLYSLLYEHPAISSIGTDSRFHVMENVKTQEDILSFLDYRCFVEHLIPCEFRSEKFMYADCDDAYLCLRFDPRLLSLRRVRNEIPVLTMRVFPKSSGFRFTDEFVRSFMHWFCASFMQTDISSLPDDEVMFHMEVTMPEVWFSDVTCMHMTERKTAIQKYPVWLRHDCIVRERVFSHVGFSLRSLLALMYPAMHESYVRMSAACDVIIGMMKKLGFVLAQEIQCASYTLDVTPRFVLGI